MIKYFKIKNFLSFKQETIVNFESSNYGNKKHNVFHIKNGKKQKTLLKSLLIYGANASGKSNLLEAVGCLRHIALSTQENPYKKVSFLLDSHSKQEPSFMELCFYMGKHEYIYNFELLDGNIISENLIQILNDQNIFLFTRRNQELTFDASFSKEGEKGVGKMKEGVSFFAVLSQWNAKLEGKDIDFIFQKIGIISEVNGIRSTLDMLELSTSDKNKEIAIEFFRSAGVNIVDIDISYEEIPEKFLRDVSNLLGERQVEKKRPVVKFGYKTENDTIQYFDLGMESSGTQKLFCILGPILDAILTEKILFIDDIETNLHPHILRNIFDLIHSDSNRKYQFIFSTHNVDLMSLGVFKKAQIGIVHKDDTGASEFYTLDDFAEIRSENNIRNMYNIGSFGGVPNLGDFSILVDELDLWEKN